MLQTNLENKLKWINRMSVITAHRIESLKNKSYPRAKLAYVAHIEPKMLSHIEFYIKKGIELYVAPCVPGIADVESFKYLEKAGAKTFGVHASTWEDLNGAWAEMINNSPDYIFDIGGGLIKMAAQKGLKIKAASEATGTGINIIKDLDLNFPVFNWNDINIKKFMHNRYEVGSGVWYAFRNLTGLDICRMNVGVIGFGLAGQSVASTAKGLGARVWIYDQDNTKMMIAASEGYMTSELDDMFKNIDILITATGKNNIITEKTLPDFRDGLIIGNAGHDDRETNLEAIRNAEEIIPGIDMYRHNSKAIYLLCKGKLLNLAAGGGSAVNTFDLVTAIMLDVIDFLMTSGMDHPKGLHMLPHHIEENLIKLARTGFIPQSK